MSRSWLIALVVLTGCKAGADPVIQCQQRLVAARDAPFASDDKFGYRPYARMDRSGCNPKQLAMLDRLLALTKAMPGLVEANERAATHGNEQAHMAAFQRMNDAIIELNDLHQAMDADLARMAAPQ